MLSRYLVTVYRQHSLHLVNITDTNINLTASYLRVSFMPSSALRDLQMLLLNPHNRPLR